MGFLLFTKNTIDHKIINVEGFIKNKTCSLWYCRSSWLKARCLYMSMHSISFWSEVCKQKRKKRLYVSITLIGYERTNKMITKVNIILVEDPRPSDMTARIRIIDRIATSQPLSARSLSSLPFFAHSLPLTAHSLPLTALYSPSLCDLYLFLTLSKMNLSLPRSFLFHIPWCISLSLFTTFFLCFWPYYASSSASSYFFVIISLFLLNFC